MSTTTLQTPVKTPAGKSEEDLFREYLAGKKILVVDASPSSKSTIVKTLIDLGAPMSNITLAKSYQDGELEISRIKPAFVIADYTLGTKCGLDLLQKQRNEVEDTKTSLFVLVTGNTSQSTVARAAEEDVDAFILKPFSATSFRSLLLKAAILKIHPSNYVQEINKGKIELTNGKLEEAKKIFEGALALDAAPSLALFYLGQVELVKQAIGEAESNYSKGLHYNKIHYKCMVGLYEVFMSQKRFVDAYEVVKKISQYFPANPQRLTSVLKLAIVTHSYEDVERYYQIFTKIDERSEEAVRYVCAALVVCGKYYLQTRVPSRALELFQKAAITGSSRPKILHEIIAALLEEKNSKDAREFLKRFPPEKQSGSEYKALAFAVDEVGAPDSPLILDRGRKLLSEGVEDPLVYKVLIRRALDADLKPLVETYYDKLKAKWPDESEHMRVLIERKESGKP